MKLLPLVLVLLVIISAVTFSPAQQQRVWIPQSIETLQQSASSKNEFTFDHSMLVLASKLEPDSDDLRRVIAGVSGVSIRRFHFPQSWQYDPETLNSVDQEYRLAGWKHLTYNRESRGNAGATNLWFRMENNAISNVAIFLASEKEVNFVVISGSISPLDLSHLGGHFGIPKIEGGVVVPNALSPK
jgi:hypothetical protein